MPDKPDAKQVEKTDAGCPVCCEDEPDPQAVTELAAESLLIGELLRCAAAADTEEESVWVNLDELSPAEILLLLGLLASQE